MIMTPLQSWFLNGVFLTSFLFFISSADARRKIEKPCPVVLPEGPRALRNNTQTQGRIINGEPSTNLQPYMGALLSYGELVCSATLISEYWALTAAHCLFTPENAIFVTGGDTIYDGVEIEIEKGIVHELYPINSETNIINDIQLIKLKKPAPPTAKFVKLNARGSIPAPYSFVRTSGYGETLGTSYPTSGVLRQVDVPVQPMEVCQRQYEGISIFRTYHVCAGYVRGGCDSCSGDSGGPLLIFDENLNAIQIGIVSFGYECAKPEASGVYTRISSQLDWIRKQGADFEKSEFGVAVFADPETGRPVSASNVADNALSTIESAPKPVAVELKPESETSNDSTSEESVLIEIQLVENSTTVESPPSSAGNGSSSTSSDSECFPGSAIVSLEDGSSKRMQDIQIGDSVHVGGGKFSKVFMFTHRLADGIYEFVKLTNSAMDSGLLLTKGHILSLNGKYVAAENARVGDVVETGDGGTAEILEIETVRASGLYNPQTVDGRIVVNGVVASTYTAAIDIETAHAALSPLRYLWSFFGSDVSGGLLENGMPSFGVM